MLRLEVLRGKGRIPIALRNGESVMLGYVQWSNQNLRSWLSGSMEWREFEYGRCHNSKI